MAVPTAVTIPSRSATAGVAFTFATAPTTPTDITWLPGDILIAINTSADTARTVTITSKPKTKRTNVVITAESIPFGAYHVFPRFPAQRADLLQIQGSTTDIKFARLSTAGQPS